MGNVTVQDLIKLLLFGLKPRTNHRNRLLATFEKYNSLINPDGSEENSQSLINFF